MGDAGCSAFPNEKQSLWPESHSMDGAAVCELTTRISKRPGQVLACGICWVLNSLGVFVFD